MATQQAGLQKGYSKRQTSVKINVALEVKIYLKKGFEEQYKRQGYQQRRIFG